MMSGNGIVFGEARVDVVVVSVAGGAAVSGGVRGAVVARVWRTVVGGEFDGGVGGGVEGWWGGGTVGFGGPVCGDGDGDGDE